jgi:hypothetical protein
MKKEFDCVEMKRQVQAEHRREAEELGEEEAARRQWERVLADPVLGKIGTGTLAGVEPRRPERIEIDAGKDPWI